MLPTYIKKVKFINKKNFLSSSLRSPKCVKLTADHEISDLYKCIKAKFNVQTYFKIACSKNFFYIV